MRKEICLECEHTRGTEICTTCFYTNDSLPTNFATTEDYYIEVGRELAKIYHEKDKRYGSSVEKGYNKRGLNSLLWRLEDKMNRLEHMVENPSVGDYGESIDDTLTDIANYCMIVLAIRRKKGESSC